MFKTNKHQKARPWVARLAATLIVLSTGNPKPGGKRKSQLSYPHTWYGTVYYHTARYNSLLQVLTHVPKSSAPHSTTREGEPQLPQDSLLPHHQHTTSVSNVQRTIQIKRLPRLGLREAEFFNSAAYIKACLGVARYKHGQHTGRLYDQKFAHSSRSKYHSLLKIT